MTHVQPIQRQSTHIPGRRRRMDMIMPLRMFGGVQTAVQTMRRTAVVQVNEGAALMSVAATASLRLVCGDRESAISTARRTRARNPGTRPVLLVHGLGGAKSNWFLIAQALTARGLTVETVSYAPLGTSVEQLAERLVAQAERALSRTAADKVHLVGHSLGGVIIAQAIRDPRLKGRVDTVVTLGSPFGGSPWAAALPFVELVRALRPGSSLLRRLASSPLPDGVRWLSVTAAHDIVVPGLRSVPFHAQVETITCKDVGHLGMLLSQRVISCIAAALCASGTATAVDATTRLLPTAS